MREKLQDEFHEAVKALRSPTEFEGNHRIAGLTSYLSIFVNYVDDVDCVIGYMVKIFKNYRDYIAPNKTTHKKKCRGLKFGSTHPKGLDQEDDAHIIGHGLVFNHKSFVASHK